MMLPTETLNSIILEAEDKYARLKESYDDLFAAHTLACQVLEEETDCSCIFEEDLCSVWCARCTVLGSHE